jgi:hypothetical protein
MPAYASVFRFSDSRQTSCLAAELRRERKGGTDVSTRVFEDGPCNSNASRYRCRWAFIGVKMPRDRKRKRFPKIGIVGSNLIPAVEYWKKYDAGEFK